MQAEVIAIGDEITSGERLDTNSQWLSRQLTQMGIRVLFHSTVGDELDAVAQVFAHAIERADLIAATGGLGPTADDLTRDGLAQAMGADLELDEASLAHIRQLFESRGRTMPEKNQVQAMFPAGSRPIPNPEGTAPGIHLEVAREGRPPCRLFCFPGVPAEMKQMWEQTALPEITGLVGEPRVIRHRVIKCFGIGESHLEEKLPDLIRRGRRPSVGITVHEATISLRITADGATPEDCYAAMEPTIATIRTSLGNLIFGEEEDELEDAVVRLLVERNQTLSTAELSDGRMAHWLGNVPGSEAVYHGGMIGEQTIEAGLLQGQSPVTAAEDIEHVQVIAQQCREEFATDYGLATSRYPDLSLPEASRPKFLAALAGPDGTLTRRFTYLGHTAILKSRAAKQALNLLRLHLLGES